MNLRTLKKLSKRAVPVLIAEHQIDPADILPADGEETCDAPTSLERQYQERGFFSPLPGTPMVWRKTSWEYDEWEAMPAYLYLKDLEFWQNFVPDEDDLDRMFPPVDPEIQVLTGERA